MVIIINIVIDLLYLNSNHSATLLNMNVFYLWYMYISYYNQRNWFLTVWYYSTQIVVEFTNLNKQRKHSIQKAESFQEITSATSLDLPAINRLLSAIQNSDTFVMGEQEDAQEFLTCLLNGLNDEMVEVSVDIYWH